MTERPRTLCPTCGEAIEPDEVNVVEADELAEMPPTFGGTGEIEVIRRAAFHPACFPQRHPRWRLV
jgi:hypothetical protein